MLVKSGELILTEDDIKQSKEGNVSKRVKETWGLSLEELNQVVANKDYKTIKDESKE